jgi:putative molybdenum carrier protein
MEKTTVDEAAQRLKEWITDNSISIIKVAGPRQSRGPPIYNTTLEILQPTFI